MQVEMQFKINGTVVPMGDVPSEYLPVLAMALNNEIKERKKYEQGN